MHGVLTKQKIKRNKRKQQNSDFSICQNEDNGGYFDDSDSFKKQKFRSRIKKNNNNKKKFNHSQWQVKQEQLFLNFMISKREIFQNRQLRRSKKIFKLMSKFIQTRSSEQCRSHHQKYDQRGGTFDNIITLIRQKIEEQKKRQQEPPPHLKQKIISYKKNGGSTMNEQKKGTAKMTEEGKIIMAQEMVKNERGLKILNTSQEGVTIFGVENTNELILFLNIDDFLLN